VKKHNHKHKHNHKLTQKTQAATGDRSKMGLRYNLGSGPVKKPGYVNVDRSKAAKPDVLADINIVPWEWAKSNSAERIECDNFPEHIERYHWIKLVRECHRVLKPNGILWIKVPVLAADNLDACFSDPTHINFFTMHTFDYYDHRHVRWRNYGRHYGIPAFERARPDQRKDRFVTAHLRAKK